MTKYDILTKVMELIPSNAKITDTCFEGANIVIYSQSKEFVLNSKDLIRNIVGSIKKRIEVRPDPKILINKKEAERMINEAVPEEAGLKDVWFDDERSIVILEAERPGSVIGKGGSIINKIRNDTLWIPFVRRAPAIKSDIVKTIRYTVFSNSAYRRKFLDKIGRRIYGKPISKDKYWIRLSCLGGFREVGRSCLILQTPDSRVMLDCGVNVASDENAFPYLEAPEAEIKSIDGVVVTHPHLDHCGLVPLLYKYGYRGPVYCNEPTRDIMTLLQLDYVDVAQREGKKLIYDSRDIKEMIKHTICLPYDEVTDITNDVRLTLHNSGHVLGSSLVHFNIGDGYHNMIYTGDFKFNKTKMLDPAKTQFQRVETLIMESTYGAKGDVYQPLTSCEDELIGLINESIKTKGKVLVPVLGVGRAQEIMLVIEEAVRKGRINSEVPIHVDGMVWDVTAIHTTYPEFMNTDVRRLVFQKGQNPFLSEYFNRVGSQKERAQIIDGPGPCVILATSGMLMGGSSVEYFRGLAENPNNRIVFVSFQGQGSLGRRIQSGEKTIKMEGRRGGVEVVHVKMSVNTIEGFSGHSSREELINYVRRINPTPKRIIVGHGESNKCLDLAGTLHKLFRVETQAPRNLDALRIR